MRLFLARHGQSVGNATGDDPKLSEKDKDKLTDRGKKDAARLGDAVKAAGVHQLYHSPATRARETADLAAQAAGAKVEGEPLEAVRALTPGSRRPRGPPRSFGW